MPKVDDLTILLKMKDKTAPAFKSLNKRLGGLSGLVGKLAKGFAAIGVAAASGFGAAVLRGQEFVREINAMSKALGIGRQEADALYQILKESNPTAQIDRVKEGVLTLTEAFFDARAESGPLFDLMKDFGAEIDFSVEGPREQLAEFLRVIKQLPTETERVGAAISVLGGDDAKDFLPLIRNIELADTRMQQLRGSIADVNGVLSEADYDRIDDATEATNRLNSEWEQFGKLANRIVAPAIEATSSIFADFIKGARIQLRAFLEDVGLLENRDRIQQIKTEISETTKLISARKDSIETLEGFDMSSSIMGNEQNALNIENSKNKVVELNNELNSLRLELEALSAQDTLPDIIDPPSAGTSSDSSSSSSSSSSSASTSSGSTVVEKIKSQADAARELAESYSVTSEQLKLFNADSIAAAQASQNMSSVLNSLGSAVGSLGEVFGKTKKSAKNFVAIQEILSLVSAYSAATQSLAAAPGGPFARFAAYASVLARGLAGYAAVKRAGRSLGSSGGSSGATTSTASTASTATNASITNQDRQQTTQGPNVTIQLSGRGRFESDMVEELAREMTRLGVLRGNVTIA